MSSNSRRKPRPNRSIIGDDILPQTATKLTKTCSSKFGGLLRRHLTSWRKTAIWCITTIPFVHESPKHILESMLPVRLLVRTNLFIPSDFLTTDAKFDNCCQRYIVTCGKKIYRCTSTFSSLKCCGEILLKSFCYMKVVCTNFIRQFLEFSQFSTAISQISWRHLAMEMDTL